MTDVNISPNMNLPVPVVGEDAGPDWANNINACLSNIDSHTHTTGSGVPITPAAINVNADLAFNNNNATLLRTLRFLAQSATPAGASDLGCLFELGVDLYYTDGAGNVVRLTQGGAVTGSSGTITGLPSGTASASYSTGTFTFQGATNTPAAMDFGPITIRQQIANGKGVTVSPANSQSVNFAYTLPAALPASNSSAVVSDTSGNLTYVLLIPATDITAGLVVNPTVYYEGTTYNGVALTVAGLGNFASATPTTESWFIPYQTYDGSWHLRFSLYFTLSSSQNSGSISIAGINFAGTVLKQAITVSSTNILHPANAWAIPNTNHIQTFLESTLVNDAWAMSGDVQLSTKPTWAN